MCNWVTMLYSIKKYIGEITIKIKKKYMPHSWTSRASSYHSLMPNIFTELILIKPKYLYTRGTNIIYLINFYDRYVSFF